jgi:hypothetical protein
VETTKGSRGRRGRLTLRTIIRGWPWYYETTPIFPREILLRAIPNAPGYLKEDMGNWAVDPYAFEPNKKRDTDGMSFFRLDFTTPKEVADANRHPDRARVVRITVEQLHGLGLAVECDPDPLELAGHVIVPDMKFAKRSKDEKRKIADLSQKLAQFASRNKVYSPRGLPNPVRRPQN